MAFRSEQYASENTLNSPLSQEAQPQECFPQHDITPLKFLQSNGNSVTVLVFSLTFLPTGSKDGTVQLFDKAKDWMPTKIVLMPTQNGVTAEIVHMVFSLVGKFLAVRNCNRDIVIWDLKTDTTAPMKTLRQSLLEAPFVFSSDGESLLPLSSQGQRLVIVQSM
jgi:WD40 repeat protein